MGYTVTGPRVVDGGAGFDTLRTGAGTVLTGAEITSVDRLEVSLVSGAYLTAEQLDRFAIVAPLGGYTEARLTLTGGGVARIAPDAALDILTITGAVSGAGTPAEETLVLNDEDADPTRLVYAGGSGLTAADVFGGAGDDRLEGGQGNDTLTGYGGNDVLAGDLVGSDYGHADELDGGEGNDTLHAGRGDSAEGGDGDDRLVLSFLPAGPVTLDGGGGYDTLEVAAGSDITGAGLDDLTALERLEAPDGGGVSLTAAQLSRFSDLAPVGGRTEAVIRLTEGGLVQEPRIDAQLEVLRVFGAGSAEEFLLDRESATTLDYLGGGGDDRAGGGLGNDGLDGGDGDDSLFGAEGDDLLEGGPGTDVALFLFTTGGIEVDLALVGRQDTGQGNDLLRSIEGLVGGSEDDVFRGTGAGNALTGGLGDDLLVGRAGADVLIGGEDNDGMEGGAGADTLSGGTGNDTFILQQVEHSRSIARGDVITDFDPAGGDLIDLGGIDADTGSAGNQGFDFIANASFSGVAGELRFAGGRLLGDVDGDGAADFGLTVQGVATLSESDLLL
jgi:Ca2+-binding RTX toxin-like protein